MKKNDKKQSGQVFTPKFIVDNMLDYCGYTGSAIVDKHIIDNSCGCGAFLCEIADRYCSACLDAGLSTETTKHGLCKYIHGLDLDTAAIDDCIRKLNAIVAKYGIFDIHWDIRVENALKVGEYDGLMDFVVGNPPYVRVHNLETNYSDVKTFAFNKDGMTDLYLAFYEIGFNMLAEGGKLCYITPSSWLNSLAATSMRRYIMRHRNLISVVDLEHFQPFDNVTTYTMIALFSKDGRNDRFGYYIYDTHSKSRIHVCDLAYTDIYIDGNFYLSDCSALNALHCIKTAPVTQFARVKNGFATLADNVFINDIIPDSPYTIKTIKASTGKWHKCFFPYDHNGKPIVAEQVFANNGIKMYMESRRRDILKNKEDFPEWYLYGRTQALADVCKRKIAINTIIKDIDSIRLEEVPAGCGVYSGLYILTDESIDTIKSIIINPDFIEYVALLKKYKSGGYYTFNSKDIEQYINYKLTYNNENREQHIA